MAYDPNEARNKGKFSKVQGAGATPKAKTSFKLPTFGKSSHQSVQLAPSFLPTGLSSDKQKFVGQKVGKAEHVFAAGVEKQIAKATGGQWLDDNEPIDVRIKRGDQEHGLEVKSLLKGNKKEISVHDDALLRKVNYQKQDPTRTVHTVAWDHRDVYEGGAHADNFSGHNLYYRRGSGRYSLNSMHKVKDLEHLSQLIGMKDKELPESARGSLPKGKAIQELKKSAEKAHASRLLKDRARKARIKALKAGA